jgi:predicted Zn-dependent protease
VNLAQVTMRLGRSEEALELAARAVDILSGENPGNLAAEALVTLGEAQLLNDRAAEGQASLHAAARQLRQLPRSRGVTAVYRYLGDVWDRHGNTGEAMRAYQEGLTAGGADALPAPPQHRAVARTT